MGFGPPQGFGGGGAPSDAEFITVTADSTLSNEQLPSTGIASKYLIEPPVETSGTPFSIKVTGAAHTTLDAGVESQDFDFDMNRVVQYSTGGIASQRAMYLQGATYAFVAASTITNAYALHVVQCSSGSNCTITNNYALYAQNHVKIAGNLYMQSSEVSDSANFPIYINQNSATQRPIYQEAPNTSSSCGNRLKVVAAGGLSYMEKIGSNVTIETCAGPATVFISGNSSGSVGDDVYIQTTIAKDIFLKTNSLTRAVVKSTGEFLIGNSSVNGTEKLQVNGSYAQITYPAVGRQTYLYLENSTSPAANDTGCTIDMYVRDSQGMRQFAEILGSAQDVTFGSQDGRLQFGVLEDGTQQANTPYTITGNEGHIWHRNGNQVMTLDETDLEIDVDLNHDGTNVGFYGTAPTAQAAHIADPAGQTTDLDVEARTAIDAILVVLENLGLTAAA